MQRSEIGLDLVLGTLLLWVPIACVCRMLRSVICIDLVTENLLVVGSDCVRALSMQCLEVSLVVGCCEKLPADLVQIDVGRLLMQWSRLVFSTLFLKTVLISVLVANALLDMDAGSKVLPFGW